MELEKFSYDNKTVRNFLYATTAFGVIGMIVGLLISLQLAFPEWFRDVLNMPILTFGRLRPLHTNAVIFAFVGNGLFAGIYYSLQRLLKTRMYSDTLSSINFWGWQLIILSAVITLPLGYTSGKEYAELEWPIDIAITLIWVVFGWNMFGTIIKRRERHLYVAIWFYIATFVTVAMLHIVNSFELPVGFLKSYSWYAGVQDALVQWWYGHNAVAFFLTTPYLGLMYYFIPKAANRPVYSYRLSIIHFWALIFIYIWAGPHHLLYTALPDWAQSIGVVFSIMLIAPSWGGMLNGLLTLRGAWDRVRENATLKFMVVAVTCYGMATFEGPMMALKNINAISHYTDWTIAHVHIGGLGWNGFLTFGMLYFLIPKMWRTNLYSKKLADFHFWIGTLGIIFWALPMYWAGFTQSLMWKEFTVEGFLKYPNFLETVTQLKPMYALRSFGGLLYLIGACVMVYNLVKTALMGSFLANEEAEAPALEAEYKPHAKEGWHRWIERRPIQMLVFSLIVVAIGGVIEIVPTFLIESNVPTITAVKPYTPLELQGRDIYIEEGCYNCHSQMIRPFRSETERYGEYSKAGEFVYDHPFQWGSKRTGPDIHRIGGKYPDSWHYNHMLDPEIMSPGTLMPPYPWMMENEIDTASTKVKIEAMITLGVPYPEGYGSVANADLLDQAQGIADNLKRDGIEVEGNKDIIALIAYLQRLGTDIKAKPAQQ
ncbi:MAG: cytochrome-c oxidase, cbb3-type subunit I [Flavobacteriales bacterium]|jgi:cytochrome c oxidase cbb3-type subunit I/II|nr:cytochrome-c oxidase, cbb3-type subunit I [Flavobacteriales bacterium]